MSSSGDTVPRTANLLACRQWWKVCFLYGDQEKYYRQVYGKAASQRLAMSSSSTLAPGTITNGTATITTTSAASAGFKQTKGNFNSKIIFPTKQHNPVYIPATSSHSLEDGGVGGYGGSGEMVTSRSRVTVLDDPFLFGLCDSNDNNNNNNGSDSGINVDAMCTPNNKYKFNSNSNSNDDLKLSEEELKMLHFNRMRRSGGYTNNNNNNNCVGGVMSGVNGGISCYDTSYNSDLHNNGFHFKSVDDHLNKLNDFHPPPSRPTSAASPTAAVTAATGLLSIKHNNNVDVNYKIECPSYKLPAGQYDHISGLQYDTVDNICSE